MNVRRAICVGLVCSAWLLASACGGVLVADAPGILVLDTSPEDIIVLVDDVAVPVREVGGERFVSLPPGNRRVTLTAESFLTHRFDVRVSPGERLSLAIELWPVVPELDGAVGD